jgi:hypothetical protein
MLSLLKHSRYRNDCGYNPTSFSKSSPAIANIEVSDSFADIINITATAVLGYGDYEYKLMTECIKTTLFF